MASKNWLFSGIYLSSILIGWGIAFAGSQYAYRTLILEDLDSLTSPTVEQGEAAPNKKTVSRTPSKSSYTTSITRRNIFDSSQAQKPPETQKNAGEDMTISDIDAQLMGTIVMKPAESSLAMIQVRSNNAITPYGVGDQLLDAKIEVIEPEFVWIRRNNQLEVLQLHGEKKVAGSANKAKDKSKSDDDSGVSKSGKDKYTVDQAVFDELLQNPEKLYTQIRATEHKKDGEVDGYRVSGIRRKSIFYKLGIKNGDVIHNVNGMTLTNLNEAMKAFESLQSSRDFNFDITRRRKKRTMEYEVR
jgi:general secretion pathway protein C